MLNSKKVRKAPKVDRRRVKRNKRKGSAKKASLPSSMEWSAKDLVNKWTRELPQDQLTGLPWELMSTLVSGLSDDTRLPKQRFLECIRTRNVAGVIGIARNLDVTEYTSADLLLQDRLVAELFKKFDFPNSPFNKREKAQLRFHEAEERCRETNLRVGRCTTMSNKQNAVIHRAIRIINGVLGEFNLSDMLDYSRFGPGASLCCTGPYTTEYFKLCTARPTVSNDALPYAEALLAFDVKWRGALSGIRPFDIWGPFSALPSVVREVLSVVKANKVTFVPKNAETERSIAIEPYFNLYFQLGIGGMIRQRLNAVGINLDTQARNQAMAMIGSINGTLATIDFSMASDTISRETVRLLLPPSWFEHLDRLRSKNYTLAGAKPRFYQKFSSMGNGFTFELETLIFYALAVATCDELELNHQHVSVFGDDVIIPTDGCELYIDVCNFLGFKVNEEKSFTSGNFRESCGEDYLKGFRVRPVFCTELRTTQHVASLANRLLALNRAVGYGSRVNDMLSSAVSLLHSRIPRDVRELVIGPPSEDVDGYIHVEQTERLAACQLVRWNRRLFCWEHPSITFRATKLKRCNDAAELWINFGTRVMRSAIPKQKVLVDGLQRLVTKYRVSDFSDLIDGVVPREITGRKIGSYHLGRRATWSLHGS